MLGKTNHTKLIILIDPDKYNPELVKMANASKVYCFFVGGSKIKKGLFEKTIRSIKSLSKIPVIIFPGDESQISKQADGILILSLVSGRNPEYLIGKHVKSAIKIKATKLPTYPTGYILVNGNAVSTTQKVTNTKPLQTKKEIIETAIAAELLGKKLIYLEAGSGANNTLKTSIINAVKKHISVPLIVGGGINSIKKAQAIVKTKPDYIVIGNALENNPSFLLDLSKII